MKHHSTPTKSFILLVGVVFLSALLALILYDWQNDNLNRNDNINQQENTQTTNNDLVSTYGWKTYTDINFPLQIQLPEDWTIKTNQNIANIYTITLQPEEPVGNLRIFISEKGFAGIKGLASTDFTTKYGYSGLKIEDGIYAIKNNEYYYTFDGTLNPEIKDTFYTIINNLKFE